MNKASFLTLVRQASRISDQEVEELEKLIVNFPYCQTAHLLLAKAAYDQGSMLSNQKLKKAAIYAANRQLLKKLIYTSDATVALQPVTEAHTNKVVAEHIASLVQPTAEKNKIEIHNSKAFVEAAVESETLSEPALKTELTDPENLTVAETPAPDTSPDHETEVSENKTEAENSTVKIQEEVLGETAEVFPTDHEDAAIAEEILETELNLEAVVLDSANSVLSFNSEKEPEVEISSAEEIAFKSDPEKETEELVLETNKASKSEIHGSETVGKTAGKVGEEIAEPLTEEEISEQVILAEEVQIAAAFENADPDFIDSEEQATEKAAALELVEISESETEAEQENAPEPVLNDDMLHETLASFDRYLFKPEKEIPEAVPQEDLKVLVPENEIDAIYANDSIGYWMNSSRLGESLEYKNDLTTAKPFDFHPELIWEYNKTHELQKEIKPAPSKLSHQLDIIDNFLKMTPRLKAMAHQKMKPEAQEDLSSKSSKISKNLASENFANILVQQGKIKKAIKIYEHLILKIPEKKAYFASQIEKLQNPE